MIKSGKKIKLISVLPLFCKPKITIFQLLQHPEKTQEIFFLLFYPNQNLSCTNGQTGLSFVWYI